MNAFLTMVTFFSPLGQPPYRSNLDSYHQRNQLRAVSLRLAVGISHYRLDHLDLSNRFWKVECWIFSKTDRQECGFMSVNHQICRFEIAWTEIPLVVKSIFGDRWTKSSVWLLVLLNSKGHPYTQRTKTAFYIRQRGACEVHQGITKRCCTSLSLTRVLFLVGTSWFGMTAMASCFGFCKQLVGQGGGPGGLGSSGATIHRIEKNERLNS